MCRAQAPVAETSTPYQTDRLHRPEALPRQKPVPRRQARQTPARSPTARAPSAGAYGGARPDRRTRPHRIPRRRFAPDAAQNAPEATRNPERARSRANGGCGKRRMRQIADAANGGCGKRRMRQIADAANRGSIRIKPKNERKKEIVSQRQKALGRRGKSRIN